MDNKTEGWKPSRLRTKNENENSSIKDLMDLLNKISIENYTKLIDKIDNLEISNLQVLKQFCRNIFDKAVREPKFCNIYANLISRLKDKTVQDLSSIQPISFRYEFIKLCQTEFESIQNNISSNKQSPSKQISSNNSPSNNISNNNSPSNNTSNNNSSSNNSPSNNSPSNNSPSNNSPSNNSPSNNSPSNNSPSNNSPSNNSASNNSSNKESSTNNTSNNESSTNDSLSNESSNNNSPSDNTSNKESSTNETSNKESLRNEPIDKEISTSSFDNNSLNSNPLNNKEEVNKQCSNKQRVSKEEEEWRYHKHIEGILLLLCAMYNVKLITASIVKRYCLDRLLTIAEQSISSYAPESICNMIKTLDDNMVEIGIIGNVAESYIKRLEQLKIEVKKYHTMRVVFSIQDSVEILKKFVNISNENNKTNDERSVYEKKIIIFNKPQSSIRDSRKKINRYPNPDYKNNSHK
jgi:hypothetical protein